MSTPARIALGIIVALVVVGGIIAFTVLRPPAEASRPIEAVPIATAAPAATAAPTAAAAAAPTAAAAATVAPTAAAAATAAPTAAAAATAAPTAAAAATAAPTAAPVAETIFSIIPEESQARFIIDEVLNNAPVTVVGATNQVAGQIAINPANPGSSRVGIVQINARTLATDNEFRDRAIKNSILTTDQFEFITFEPTALSGLPQAGAVGQSYSFQLTGNLTVRDVTREVTFDVSVTPVSEGRLEGSAATVIRYADFGLSIPSVPSVASVADEVRLELQFVAVA